LTTSVNIMNGDCRAVISKLPAESVDAIITDPPYELNFMGSSWDNSGVAYDVGLWKNCLNVIKPGGYLLAFGGTRTYHRLACAIEDAGFEIRDSLHWIYGSGFPKSLDVSKAIDKAAGFPREKVLATGGLHKNTILNDDGWSKIGQQSPLMDSPVPESDDAKQWNGWGTALKPAHEPIVLARKPIAEKTVATNVLKYGTGGINIDGCRVGTEDKLVRPFVKRDDNEVYGKGLGAGVQDEPDGRWPPNVLLSDGVAEELGDQSQFFPIFKYQAKAPKKERTFSSGSHPTVKPVALIEWLIDLVTKPGDIILDPFAGTGTTGLAAINKNRECILIENIPEYIKIIQEKLNI
jgi:DNA modification methylase